MGSRREGEMSLKLTAVWIIHTMQAISVRRRLVPRKQSRYEVPACMTFSTSSVWIIWAMRSSEGIPPALSEPSERRLALASSSRPCRTSHQGDSGAKKTPARMGTGHTH